MKLKIEPIQARHLASHSVHHITRIAAEGWIATVVIESTHSLPMATSAGGLVCAVFILVILSVRD